MNTSSKVILLPTHNSLWVQTVLRSYDFCVFSMTTSWVSLNKRIRLSLLAFHLSPTVYHLVLQALRLASNTNKHKTILINSNLRDKIQWYSLFSVNEPYQRPKKAQTAVLCNNKRTARISRRERVCLPVRPRAVSILAFIWVRVTKTVYCTYSLLNTSVIAVGPTRLIKAFGHNKTSFTINFLKSEKGFAMTTHLYNILCFCDRGNKIIMIILLFYLFYVNSPGNRTWQWPSYRFQR